ncbi:hypothetical protein [Aureispira anguillae]|uniref:Lipoprotein n=1 Tax=Aureispira anguillae TaxID=2864201 RepID=A0A915YJG6_9BACT|nr:hypothetical protein [Aureispira anguillae]BDS14338.1 hypothetical protein AsAng_0051170 [Aureispira anguillae]
MQKLLLGVISLIFFIVACEETPVSVEMKGEKLGKSNLKNEIKIPSCYLYFNSKFNHSQLNEHVKLFGEYVIDTLSRDVKNGFSNKKYYLKVNVYIKYDELLNIGIKPYIEYVNNLEVNMHNPLGYMNEYPSTDMMFTYTPIYDSDSSYEEKSSFIKISVETRDTSMLIY